MPLPSDTPDQARREFLKRVAAAGIATALPASVLAQVPPAPRDTTAASPGAPAPAAPAAPATPSEEAKALAAVLRARYGDRLSAQEWDSVLEDIDGRLAAGKKLRAPALANGDEPDATFRAVER